MARSLVAVPTGIANCPLGKVLTYKSLSYLLNFQFYNFVIISLLINAVILLLNCLVLSISLHKFSLSLLVFNGICST